MHATLAFVRRERRFLAFGFLLTLVSSFGQTFFVSLSSRPLRERFELTDGEFGLVYSLATLASGLVIVQAGRIVDAVDLRWVVALVLGGLGLAAGVIASAPAVIVLGLGLFALRLCGQGLCGHVSATAMARTYDRRRGLALSLAGLGYAAGEALLPFTAVLVLQSLGWRPLWAIVAGVILLLVLPLASWLLRGTAPERLRPGLAGASAPGAAPTVTATTRPGTDLHLGPAPGPQPEPAPRSTVRPDWTRRAVLRDPRFLLILPAILAPGTIITGVFFHQVWLVEQRGWELELFAAAFVVFSATQLPAGLLGGPLLDRVGATRLLPFVALPMAAGLAVLAGVTAPVAPFLFMALIGLTIGLAGPVVGASWAELYGVRHLGSIRALATSASVIGTATSPFAAGWMIDRGVAPTPMLAWSAAAATVAAGVAWLALRWRPVGTAPPSPPPPAPSPPPPPPSSPA